MIAAKAHAQGSILPVRAKPGAKRDALVDEHDGALIVSVTAAPEDGKANEAIVRVLSRDLNVRKSAITLVAGATSRSKTFLIVGIDPDELIGRIDAALSPTVYDPPDADV